MPFGSLWLPVVVSAVVVFIASSILHMVLKYHKADYKPVPNEDAVRAAIGQGNPAPGVYMTPHCGDMKMMKDPAMQKRFETGPVALITLMPKGLPNMGKHLGLWFGFCFATSFTAGYLARHVLMPGADGLAIMRITGTVAFASYALSQVVDSIWKGQPWGNTLRFVLDGLIYTLLTAVTFCFLWPQA
jgi:hypothetical protein